MNSSNKESAVAFLRLASSGKVRQAYENYIHPDFLHHNPFFKGDRASLLKGMEESAARFPDKTFEAIRVLADGELVAVHGKVQLSPDMPRIALIYIFRFEDDLIIEEWEASQEVPVDSPNQYGIF
jgi:predicted SnoaL-like aldol condensation-catalyzing enzyme